MAQVPACASQPASLSPTLDITHDWTSMLSLRPAVHGADADGMCLQATPLATLTSTQRRC